MAFLGVISTATANLDREAQPTYKILVKAKESLGNTGREASIATVFITLLDINDNFPTFKKGKGYAHDISLQN